MHPFVNERRGVIFWWSPKCGCTTVKSIMLESMVFDHLSDLMEVRAEESRAALWRVLGGADPRGGIEEAVGGFLEGNRIESVHCLLAGPRARVSLGFASRMRNFLFVRDPLRRFVSGVVEKHFEGEFSFLFRPPSFLHAARRMDMLESHHFTPQAGGAFVPGLEHERVFDIEEIDYALLSEALGMEVTPRVLHGSRNYRGACVPGLARLAYHEVAWMKARGSLPPHECFYDDESRAIVSEFYRDDFELMRRWLNPSGA